MNWYRKNKVEDLWEWLEVAEAGLLPGDMQRITKEIEAHYAEALKSHLAQGEPGPVAEANALAELGDPWKAGKSFRKKHITAGEVGRLEQTQKDAGSVPSLLGSYLIFAFSYYFFFIALGSSANLPKIDLLLIAVAFFLIGIVSPTIAFVIAKGNWVTRRVSSLAFLRSLAFGDRGYDFIVPMIMINISTRLSILVLVSSWISEAHSWLRIWNKVRKTGEAENGVPTPA